MVCGKNILIDVQMGGMQRVGDANTGHEFPIPALAMRARFRCRWVARSGMVVERFKIEMAGVPAGAGEIVGPANVETYGNALQLK